jgi:hypothetical protein
MFAAFGDDFGKVSLSLFPCQMDVASIGCDRKTAHDGPVACIAISCDGKFVVSVGANDLCLLLWRAILIPEESSGFSEDLQSVLHKYQRDHAEHQPAAILTGPAEEEVLDAVPDYFVGLVCPPDQTMAKAVDGFGSLPREHLKLTHCHSYRGFDSRGNLGMLPHARSLVYFCAGVYAVSIFHAIVCS